MKTTPSPAEVKAALDILSNALDRPAPPAASRPINHTTCIELGLASRRFTEACKRGEIAGAWKGSKGLGWFALEADVLAWLRASTRRPEPRTVASSPHALALASYRGRNGRAA